MSEAFGDCEREDPRSGDGKSDNPEAEGDQLQWCAIRCRCSMSACRRWQENKRDEKPANERK